MYPAIIGLVVSMWLSRLYLATEFLHQCILGSYFGFRAVNAFEVNIKYLFSRPRAYAVPAVCFLGAFAGSVYFIKLHFDMDPHWSVRQVIHHNNIYQTFITYMSLLICLGLQMVPRAHIYAPRS